MEHGIERGSKIRILVVEHTLLGGQLMEAALQRERRLSVSTCVQSAAECLQTCLDLKPAVCLVSENLKDGSGTGLQLIRDIRDRNNESRTVLLLESSEPSAVVDAFRSGARGVFCRDEPYESLVKCIENVNEDKIWASPEHLQHLIAPYSDDHKSADTPKTKGILTEREQSVVRLIAEGRSNKDISRELHLSEHTVRNYLFRIFNKLGTSSRLELAIYALNQKTPSQNVAAQTSTRSELGG